MRDFFILCLLFSLFMGCFLVCFESMNGFFLADSRYSDIGFHLDRSVNPWAFFFGDRYPPLFHLWVWGVNLFVGDVIVSLSFVVSFLLFFLLPCSFFLLGGRIFGVAYAPFCGFAFMFGTVPVAFLGWGTYPQALALFFLVLGVFYFLGSIFEGVAVSRFVFVLWGLCSLSHSRGFIVFALVFIVYLFFQGRFFSASVLSFFGVLNVFFSRPVIYGLSLSRLKDIVFFWWNPIQLFLIWRGSEDSFPGNIDGIRFIGVLCSLFVVSSVFDIAFRPVMYSVAFCSLFVGKALRDSVGDFWFFVFVFSWVVYFSVMCLGIFVGYSL